MNRVEEAEVAQLKAEVENVKRFGDEEYARGDELRAEVERLEGEKRELQDGLGAWQDKATTRLSELERLGGEIAGVQDLFGEMRLGLEGAKAGAREAVAEVKRLRPVVEAAREMQRKHNRDRLPPCSCWLCEQLAAIDRQEKGDG